MRVATFLLCAFLLLGMAASHWLGHRHASGTSDSHVGGAADGRQQGAPPNGRGAGPASPYLKDAQPAEEIKPVVPRPKSWEASESAVVLTAYVTGGTVRRVRVYPVRCLGGPADGRLHLLPVSPAELLRLGSSSVWVPAFAPFTPAGELPQGQKVAITHLSPDKDRMEYESIGVYVLEERREGHVLAFEGQVDVSEYAKFLSLEQAGGDAVPFPAHLPIRTSRDAVRKQPVHPTRCVSGPADGKVCPLLVAPASLFGAGLGLVCVTEVAGRPPDKSFTISANRSPPKPYVGHVSYYAVERLPDGSFRLHFVASADAREYLSKHLPQREKDGGKP